MRRLRRLLKLTAALLLIPLFLLILASLLQIRLPLAPLNAPLASAMSAALGRKVEFAGDISLVPSLRPMLEVHRVTVANVTGGKAPWFASLGRMQLQLSIPALLNGQLHLIGLEAEKVTFNLESDRKGRPNWIFHASDPARPQRLDTRRPAGLYLAALDRLALHDIQVNYLDRAVNQSLHFVLDRLQGSLSARDPMQIEMDGKLQQRPYRLLFRGDGLERLLDRSADWRLRIEGKLGRTPLQADAHLIRNAEPSIDARLKLGHVDAGALLQYLGLVRRVEAEVAQMEAKATLRGRSLSQLLARSAFSLTLKQGSWRLRDPNSGRTLKLALQHGRLEARPGKPLKLILDARANELPLSITIGGARLVDYLAKGKPLPLKVGLSAAGARATLEARATRPLDIRKVPFHFTLSGRRLNDLSVLLGRELPPFGAYRMQGTFGLTPRGYRLTDLEIELGNSRLQGELSLDTRQQPPRLTAKLSSPRIQLNDFKLGTWSPLPSEEETHPASRPRLPRAETVHALLSPESLAAQDIDFRLDVREVLSGRDSLGGGELRLQLERGRLALDPLHLRLPGGDARLSFHYHPVGRDVELGLRARVKKLDYGILARRIDPDSDVGGRLSLRIDLEARGHDVDALLEQGAGAFDLGIWPRQLQADVFDLWAVNVLSALLRKVGGGEGSRVNCVIARMQLQKGVMRDRIIFADTSRVQVEASARIDFRQRTLEVLAKPRAKRAQFFSLATPVRLAGTFDNFSIGINPVELSGSLLSFVTSPLHVPLQRLFGHAIPKDGEAACEQAWNHDFSKNETEPPSRPSGLDILEH